MIKVLLCTFLFASAFSFNSSAQVFLNKDSSFSLAGYADGYYAYYTDSAGVGHFQKFPTVSPRSNSFSINIAMLTLKYSDSKVRGVITLHYGDIPLSTWSDTYRYIQEANAGVKLCKKLWLDAGFFRTHIGAEGLLPKENIASSVTIATFNEPYYEAGFRLDFKPTKKLTLDLYALNGYNRYEDNNEKKSAGLAATYSFNDSLNIAYTNYLGDDAEKTDSVSRFRTYNNVYLNYQRNKFRFQAAANIATQMHSDTANKKNATAFTGFLTIRYAAFQKFGFYARGEFFRDPSGFLDGLLVDAKSKLTGLKLWGATAGAEYKPAENSYVRLEARQLQCDDDQQIFHWHEKNKSSRFEIMFHIGCWF